jgi:hypothetical protein
MSQVRKFGSLIRKWTKTKRKKKGEKERKIYEKATDEDSPY